MSKQPAHRRPRAEPRADSLSAAPESSGQGALPFGPLTARTLHLCLDMQRLFSVDGPWHTPWMERVLPVVTRVAERHPHQTVFIRFIPPVTPDQVPGMWRQYFEHWREVTREKIDPGLLRLMPALQALVPPAQVIDKAAYSAFSNPALLRHLRAQGGWADRHRNRGGHLRSGHRAGRHRPRLPRHAGDGRHLQLIGRLPRGHAYALP